MHGACTILSSELNIEIQREIESGIALIILVAEDTILASEDMMHLCSIYKCHACIDWYRYLILLLLYTPFILLNYKSF
jgi:hypothetical protein